MAEIASGQVFDGRYRIERKLGAGGMADVWLAEDTHLQRQVALKILHSRYAQDREFVERFKREAESAAGLQHPNVVAVYDRGEFEGSSYIAMQYVEGPTLKALIDSGLTSEQAVLLVRQVLEAARFAHRHGIVHRDLKPQNVIVDAEGKAVVTDFGIARAGVSEITQTGSVMGTPHYLSPEQAQGFDVTPVSDLYAIGVILYEALTGRVPFEGESAVAVAMKQVSQTPQRPSSLRPTISPALDAVVMRALEKDPGQRFQSADAFIAALDQAMRQPAAGQGTQAFAPLPPVVAEPGEEDEAPKSKRHWWIIAALAAVVVGALIGLLLTRDTTTDVPNVTSKQLEFAILQLERKGFSVGEETYVEKEAPRGTVLEQDPLPSPPADQAEEDCSFLTLFCSKPKVNLTISGGPGSGSVPPTAGLPAEDATKRLEAAGFEVVTENVNSATVEEGAIVHSEPKAGQSATHGSTVKLFVSQGPKLVKVPVVTGARRAVAVERLRGRGLVPEVGEEESKSPAGEVLRQSPNAGTELEPGASVALVVSAGIEKAQVPAVIGKERRAAVERLRQAGLVPVVEEEEIPEQGRIGRVLDQLPAPHSQVEPGSTVTLIVGKRESGTIEPVEPEEKVEEKGVKDETPAGEAP
jgi:serine/threonine protein kinase